MIFLFMRLKLIAHKWSMSHSRTERPWQNQIRSEQLLVVYSAQDTFPVPLVPKNLLANNFAGQMERLNATPEGLYIVERKTA